MTHANQSPLRAAAGLSIQYPSYENERAAAAATTEKNAGAAATAETAGAAAGAAGAGARAGAAAGAAATAAMSQREQQLHPCFPAPSRG